MSAEQGLETWTRAFGDQVRDQLTTPDPKKAKSSRIPDWLFGIVLPLGAITVSTIPINEIAAACIALTMLTRRPVYRLPVFGVPLIMAVYGMLLVSGLANSLDIRRLLHLGVWCVLIVTIGQGRLHMPSFARGLTVGLVGGTIASVPSLVSGGYAGRLTGYLGDPNAAGFVLLTLGAVALSYWRGWFRGIVGLTIGAGIVLTFSRTTWSATLFALAWIWLSKRLHVSLTALILVPAAIWASGQIQQLRDTTLFMQREGSDALRERINEAAQAAIQHMPWYGNGPGSARVKVGDLTFFLHNSYDATLIEGGWIGLGLTMLLFAYVIFHMLRSKSRNLYTEAAVFASLICALSLGEVIYELYCAVALGVGFLASATSDRRHYGSDGVSALMSRVTEETSAWQGTGHSPGLVSD